MSLTQPAALEIAWMFSVTGLEVTALSLLDRMMSAIAIFAIELNTTHETSLRQKDCNTFTLR
jgi:hypothetical protein